MANNRMTLATTNERIDKLEQMMSKLDSKFDQVMAMMSEKPSNRVSGASAPKEKTPKTPKELKTYEPFEKSTETYTAKAVDSKGGNPNALLQVKFTEIPNARTRDLLKGFGFRWNRPNLTWDNANTDEAKEIFKVLK